MSVRTAVALWKANVPHWIWIGAPAWIGGMLIAYQSQQLQWGAISVFVLAVLTIQAAAEFANTYTDRDEDRLYGPTNTIVTGELDAGLARKVLIAENILAGALLVVLLALTLNYLLILVVVLGWFFSVAYSLPPFRLKETPLSAFSHAIAFALLPLAGWLVVEPSLLAQNGFILGFAGVLFLNSYALGITLKFRKTLLALNSGLVRLEPGGSIFSISTVGFNLNFRSAMTVEEVTALATFLLVPILWGLGVFGTTLSVSLLALPMTCTIMAVFLRERDAVANSSRYKMLMTLSWALIVVLLFAVGLAQHVHYGYSIAASLALLAGFPLLVRIVHPWGSKSLSSQY